MKHRSLLTRIILFLTLPAAAPAAIIYSDLNGISTFSSKYFDLDQNGTYDLGVVWSYDDWEGTTAGASLPIAAADGNGFAASGVLAIKLSAGDTIDTSMNFRSDTVMLNVYEDLWEEERWGNWDNMAEGESAYLGFRFLDDGNAIHYGWIEAYINPSSLKISLYGIAWETEAGKSIAAGATGSPVPVPSAFWLLGTGIRGLAGRLRRF